MKLWYESQAKEWTEALPLGNGHMGAMAFGGTEGLFELSENTCWSGSSQDKYILENAAVYMEKARDLLLQKRIEEAEDNLSKCCGIKENYGTQVPMGRLYIGMPEKAEKTYRELNLVTGIATDRCYYDALEIERKSFISNVDKVMAIKLSSNEARLPKLRVWLEGWSQPTNTQVEGDELIVKARALENIHSDGLHGALYVIRLKILTDGVLEWSRKGMLINNATGLTVYVTAVTSMFTDEMDAICKKRIQNAESLSFERLFDRHCQEHSDWMKRCELTLPKSKASHLPTDLRLKQYQEDKSDLDLIALFFQYGRYLLINSSRPDSLLPTALQGVWNDDRACRMCWTDDMHLDINTQMNYYPADVTGLSMCKQPLFDWTTQILMPNGEKMAQQLYGKKGWVAHSVSNAYGWAAPGWDYSWGFNMTAGGWLSSVIWEHYHYTGDQEFLRKYYPVLYGCGQFLHSILSRDPRTKALVTNPSYSPENGYLYEGKCYHITTGATSDITISKYIFKAIEKAAKILQCEDDFTMGLEAVMQQMPQYGIDKQGRLMEWYEDHDDADVGGSSKLPSHLLVLHPFNMIRPETEPELAEGIKKAMISHLKCDSKDVIHTNWGGALLILFSARLLDGLSAGLHTSYMCNGLSKPNLMFTHIGPSDSIMSDIYELDGNTGFTAGVAEMLMQSYNGEIHVLPAIPSEWHQGAFKGLVAYGGHKVDVTWDEQSLDITLHANAEGSITVRYKEERFVIGVKKGDNYSLSVTR